MTEILFVEKAPSAGTERRLEDGATIGRAGCDVTVDDSDVSRRHAIVRLEGSGVAIEDLGSTNGTFVNDARIEVATELQNGDRVRFGAVVWELRMPMQATRVAPTARPGAAATRAVPIRPPNRDEADLTVVPPAALPRQAASEPGRDESRGDVPKPDFAPSPGRSPSRTGPSPPSAPAFAPPGGRFKRSAARRMEATVVSYGIVIATAVSIAVYFAQR